MAEDFQLSCDDAERRLLLQASTTYNGISYLEVIPPGASNDLPLLLVFCYQPLPLTFGGQNVEIDGGTRIKNIAVEWAQLASAVPAPLKTLVDAEMDGTDPTTVLVVRPTGDGDFSRYTLKLVDPKDPGQPPKNFDPLLSQVDFGFKVECPQNFDCKPEKVCPPKTRQEPVIDYLTKDFNSFKTLMLNRLSLINPNWNEVNPADMGVALIEILAYVGDHLSYYQDAVATEAYLGTARRRISVRRHARLLDYFIHDGCNSRAWVAMEIDKAVDGLLVPTGTGLLTGGKGDPTVVTGGLEQELEKGATVFETMTDLTLYGSHNRLDFYTWQEENCCLPVGRTRVTLKNPGNALDLPVFTWSNVPGPDAGALAAFLMSNYGAGWLVHQSFANNGTSITSSDGVHSLSITLNGDSTKATVILDGTQVDEFVVAKSGGSLELSAHTLRMGQVLIFEEIRSPTTGRQPDADPSHRCAVRLTAVSATSDPLDSTQTPLVDVSWDPADALPFPLCLEMVLDPDFKNSPQPVTVARGNVVLADHGQTRRTGTLPSNLGYNDARGNKYTGYAELLGDTPLRDPENEQGGDANAGGFAGRFRPGLSFPPLTFAATFDAALPASSAFGYDVRTALPAITILGEGEVWLPQRDLFSSDGSAHYFVTEVERDGTAYLRFGDNVMGKAPTPSTQGNPNTFYAIYRVGNGTGGNVGRETISRIVNSSAYGTCVQAVPFDATGILKLRNPMEARGGTDPEDIEDVRKFAPYAFNSQQRAVTSQDYEDILSRQPGIRQAYAQIEWTGSWSTVFISVDRTGGLGVDGPFKEKIETLLDSYRMAGYDLEITGPTYVPLEIEIHVCAAPGYSTDTVRKKLFDAFSNTINPDGTKGFFYPDNFTFGQVVFLSKVYQVATSVVGVSSAVVKVFHRYGKVDQGELAKGEISIAASEIARLDNDTNFPENGTLKIIVEGGDAATGVGSS